MALDGNKTGSAVYNLIKSANVKNEADCEKMWQDIMKKIYADMKSDMEITVPSGQVVIAVAGSATGTMNPVPIQNEVK